ncbi:hypothetical protein JB92DRAFT_2871074 [Gautieria morchelliformis]|nr:hypothetical protein JB92DRAFT_2871074 [Gautieria morchelliformis]
MFVHRTAKTDAICHRCGASAEKSWGYCSRECGVEEALDRLTSRFKTSSTPESSPRGLPSRFQESPYSRLQRSRAPHDTRLTIDVLLAALDYDAGGATGTSTKRPSRFPPLRAGDGTHTHILDNLGRPGHNSRYVYASGERNRSPLAEDDINLWRPKYFWEDSCFDPSVAESSVSCGYSMATSLPSDDLAATDDRTWIARDSLLYARSPDANKSTHDISTSRPSSTSRNLRIFPAPRRASSRLLQTNVKGCSLPCQETRSDSPVFPDAKYLTPARKLTRP